MVHNWCSGFTNQTQINRSVIVINSLHGLDNLGAVCRFHNDHTRNGTHQRHIIQSEMGVSLNPYSNTGSKTHQLHIMMHVSQMHTHLIIHASCDERRETGDKRLVTVRCQTGSDTHHILLGDTCTQELIRIITHKTIQSR